MKKQITLSEELSKVDQRISDAFEFYRNSHDPEFRLAPVLKRIADRKIREIEEGAPKKLNYGRILVKDKDGIIYDIAWEEYLNKKSEHFYIHGHFANYLLAKDSVLMCLVDLVNGSIKSEKDVVTNGDWGIYSEIEEEVVSHNCKDDVLTSAKYIHPEFDDAAKSSLLSFLEKQLRFDKPEICISFKRKFRPIFFKDAIKFIEKNIPNGWIVLKNKHDEHEFKIQNPSPSQADPE